VRAAAFAWCELGGDYAQGDRLAAAQFPEPRGSRDDAEPAAADIPAIGADVDSESMNARLRKVTRNRGQFPSGQSALKVLYLVVRNLEESRGRNVGIRSSGCHHQRLMVLR
jgi:hypothetical protein